MKKRSHAAVLENEAYLQKMYDLHALGMYDAINDAIVWTPKVSVDGGKARFGWSRLDSAHGGIFYSWYLGDVNHGATTSVYYLDDEIKRANDHGYMIASHDKHSLALRAAVYAAQRARTAIYSGIAPKMTTEAFSEAFDAAYD